MLVFLRFLSVALLILCSCSGGRQTAQHTNPKPYYFSYKSNPAKKPVQPPATAPSEAAQPASPPAITKTPDPRPVTTQPRNFLAPQKLAAQKQETPVSDRFTGATNVPDPVTHGATISKANKPIANSANAWLLATAGLFLLAVTGLFTLLRPQARNIAHWAKQNKKKSWVLIGVLQTILGFQASFFGRVLHELGFQSNELGTHVLLAAAAVMFLVYPRQSAISGEKRERLFRKRRLLMLALLVSTFFGFMSLGNRAAANSATSPLSARIEQLSQTDDTLVSAAAQSLHALAQPGAPQVVDALAALLIFLSVLVAAYLLLMVAAVSCSIMCSGSGALALLVLLGGSALVIWGLVVVIKEAVEGARRRQGIREKAEPEAPRDPNAPRPRKQKIKWF